MLNNLDILPPNYVAGFYDYLINVSNGGEAVTISEGLIYYDIESFNVQFDSFDSQTIFKGYEPKEELQDYFLITESGDFIVTEDGDFITT